MEDQIEEVKRKTDIVSIVSQYVVLKKNGRHHKGLCPFHSEKTASFTVNEEMERFKCFGCGAGGDVIKFVMDIEGLEFREALEKLADRAGVKLVFKKNTNDGEREKMLEVLDLTARYYHWILTEGKSGEMARKYLRERRINEKLIKTFGIGFALPSWDSLSNYLAKKKGYDVSLLEKVGLVTKKSNGGGVFDKFRGRIMFPLQDAGGKVVGFSGRILPELAKEEEPKYLNSPETLLYHKGKTLFGFYQAKQAIREKKRVVLVEGQLDMVSSFGAGVTETVAVGGTALTEEQVDMIGRLTDKIYFALDKDTAGNAAMKRSIEMVERRGLGIKVVRHGEGKDPDEIARNSPAKWRELVDNSVDVYEFVMEKALNENDKKTVEGIKKITEEVIPFLAKIENNVVREVWTKRLAEKLDVDWKGVVLEIDRQKMGRQVVGTSAKSEPVEAQESKTDKLVKRLIGNLLVNIGSKNKLKVWFEGVVVEGGLGKTLSWLLSESAQVSPSEIISKAPEEIREIMAEAYMEDGIEGETEKQTEELAIQLLRELIKERKRVVREQMESVSKLGKEEEEERLLGELNDLNKKESRVISFLG